MSIFHPTCILVGGVIDLISAFVSLLLNSFFTRLSLTRESGFPKPLSAEEERRYLTAMARGDQEARNTLILHNLRLVAHVAKKYYTATDEPDDLISIGTIGLIKAVDSFKAEKNIRLATFAARCIENEIFMHFRVLKRRSVELSMQEAIETDDDGNTLEILDTLSYDDDLPELVGLKEEIRLLEHEIDRVLTARERFILIRRYGLRGHQAMTQREVAALCGISRSYISRIEKSAMEKLKNALSEG